MADTPEQPADAAPESVVDTPATATEQSDAPKQTLTGPELDTAIRVQVEYYFSKENLTRDTYLLSQMDAEHYVSIELIAGFSKVKQLSEDVDVIAKAMEGSQVCCLDESKTRIKPSNKAVPRHTVILRDTPASTTQEDVEALWKQSSFEGIEEIRPDIAGFWFVTFASEDVARDAVMWVRQQELGGEKVKARLKTENVAPSVYFAPPMPVYAAPVAFPMGGWNPELRYQYQWDQDANSNGRGGDKDRRRFQRRAKGQQQGQQQQGQQANDGRRNKRGARKQQGQQVPQSAAKKAEEFKLGANNFPPLPKKQGGEGGYTGEYQRYNKKDFISVIKAAAVARPPLPDAAVVQSEPNTELESDVPESGAPAEKADEAVAPEVVVEVTPSSSTDAPTAAGDSADSSATAAAAAAAAPDVDSPAAEAQAPAAAARPPSAQTWAQKLAATKGE